MPDSRTGSSFIPQIMATAVVSAEGRVLLTRDRELSQRCGVQTLLIASEDLDEQVRQVLAELDLEPDQTFSRCPVCNVPLELLDPEIAQSRVPAYVAQTHDTFKACPACQRVYWRGTHFEPLQGLVERILDGPPQARTIKS